MTFRRPPARRLAVPGPVLAVAALALLAGPAAVPASAAKVRYAPCPTEGRTLLRSSTAESTRYRVYRVGTALRVCTREDDRPRHIRSMGVWSRATKLAASTGVLTWTTRKRAPDGTAADTIRAIDVSDGARRLTVSKVAVATAATSPATTDTVVRLLTDDLATVWVTSRGRLAAAVRIPSLVPDPYEGPPAFHAGALFALGDTTPAQAALLGKGLTFVDDSQTDDCGGVSSRFLSIPEVPGFPIRQFNYYRDDVLPGPGC